MAADDTQQGAASGEVLVRTTTVNLTDDELALLDGRCSEKAQQAVEGARSRIGTAMRLRHLTPIQAGFIADVVTDAIDKGRLRWSQQWISYCPIHQESAGYFTFKSGPRRGEPNYKKPKGWQGVDLADRFVGVRGRVAIGGCLTCVKPLLPDLIEALRGVLAVLVLNALKRAGIPPADIAVERTKQPMRDHPIFMNFPDHMNGWEAFGVVGDDDADLIVRRLGTGYDGKGKAGTEPWGPGEVKLGVAAIEWGTFADSTSGGFLHVYGTTEVDVRLRWHTAAAALTATLGDLWPKSRPASAVRSES